MKTTEETLAHLCQNAAAPLPNATGAVPSLYWDERIAAIENAEIFRKDWVCPGMAAEIPHAGDYMTFSIDGDPIFCIRDKSGAINTYSNVCRHRMMLLLEGRGRGKSRVVCPYHAWTYDLEGQLVAAGQMEHSAGFDKKDICLPAIRTEIWNGWIYITLNAQAQSVATLLAPLEEVVSRYAMEHYIPVVNEDHVWDTNWKLLTENFMEGYHLPIAHKETVGAGFPATKTVFPEHSHDAFTYQTFRKPQSAAYGQAHPDNTRLDGVWRSTSVLPTVFPSHMYVLAPDHLWYLSLRPRGTGQVDVRFGVALAPEVDAMLTTAGESARQAWIAALVSFFEQVNSEDRRVVEGIFAGARSSCAQPGPLSWLEREIHDFQKYLARRIAPVTPQPGSSPRFTTPIYQLDPLIRFNH